MILVERLIVHAGSFRLENISFQVPEGGYAVLMGKTGCGKTTLLEAIAGLKAISHGRIVLDGSDVTRLKPAERNVGLVPQDAALFTTMSVRDHLAFALMIRKVPRAVIRRRVAELAEMLEIGHLLDRYPAGLSGGETQRVALGRALSFRPATLLLDEPLSALDDQTRDQMMGLLKRVQAETKVTTLHVTHNRREASRLANLLLELVDGRVEMSRSGSPVDARPTPAERQETRSH
ncbi:MAG TPA: ABC transporter ATP-binding protein [Planctomycetes bacterium]|nr:ABC transporter ATP-binding protein [Planctomycetota bacterium]